MAGSEAGKVHLEEWFPVMMLLLLEMILHHHTSLPTYFIEWLSKQLLVFGQCFSDRCRNALTRMTPHTVLDLSSRLKASSGGLVSSVLAHWPSKKTFIQLIGI